MTTSIENLLNDQITYEAQASMRYLAMASWADAKGYRGVAKFFYAQSKEERLHLTKLVKFVNERSSKEIAPAFEAPLSVFESVYSLFEKFLKSEIFVAEQINTIIFECIKKKDYNVHSFMQWYVTEQREDETTVRRLLDKLKTIGVDKTVHYLFDRDIVGITEGGQPEN
jgi:ferritin